MNIAVIIILILIATAIAVAAKKTAGRDAETAHHFSDSKMTTDVVIPLSRDEHRIAYWMPAFVAGRDILAVADTGSPFFIVPKSLPCVKGTDCVPTGLKTSITYGDGTTDDAVFTKSHVDLGGNHFPLVEFGGSMVAGTGSPNASDTIIGLALAKAPRGFKQSEPGRSVIEQLGAQLLEFDLTDENNASLRIAPSSRFEKDRGTLVVETPLLPRGLLWKAGVDEVVDFYVVEVDRSRLDPNLGELQYLIVDTGTTETLLPTVPKSMEVNLPIGKGVVPVDTGDIGQLPAMFGSGSQLNRKVGILGNRSLTGHRVVLDLEAGKLRLYRN